MAANVNTNTVLPTSCGFRRNGSVILATSPFRVMQVSVHQVIGVVAVRYGLVTAARAVFVRRVVSAAIMTSGR